MKDRLLLAAYAGAILVVTSVHDLRFLTGCLAAIFALAGRDLPRVARRSVASIALFNSIVTIAYVAASLIRGNLSVYYVAPINARVFTLTSLTFLMVLRVNLFEALSFSRSLTYLLTLAATQALTFGRLSEDFRMAFKSRTIDRVSARDLYRHAASTGAFFLEKSLENVSEVTHALKSRGFFSA